MMARDQLLVLAIVASWPLAGLVEPFAPGYGRYFHNKASLAHVLVLAVLLFAWCKAHAAGRGVSPPTGAPLAVALITPIGFTYYFFRAFPWRTALGSLVKVVLVFLLCGVLYWGGLYVGEHVAA